MSEEMPSHANGYYVVGRCRCGELLTMMEELLAVMGVESNPHHVTRNSVYLRHVSNYRRECTQLAEIEEHRP